MNIQTVFEKKSLTKDVTRIELLSLYSSSISIIRNIFLSTSLSFVCFTYGNTFKFLHYKKIIHFIAFVFCLFSIVYGISTAYNFYELFRIIHFDISDMNNELIFKQIKVQVYSIILSLIFVSMIAFISLHRFYYLYF